MMTRYPSQFTTVKGQQMHYVEQGEGDPVVFLHGVPTSGFVWRKIMPALADQAHCIAPDMIGMGQSAKPAIDYSIFDHIQYIEGLINNLELDDITFVMHGWGSVVGFELARRMGKRVRGLAFYEAHIRATMAWDMLALPMQQLAYLVGDEEALEKKVLDDNFMLKEFLPDCCMEKLPESVVAEYTAAYPDAASRRPLLQFLRELPLGNGEGPVVDLINGYSQFLCDSKVPKLMLYAVPGFMTTMDSVQWAKGHLQNMTCHDLGDAFHLAQETIPDKISDMLRTWYSVL